MTARETVLALLSGQPDRAMLSLQLDGGGSFAIDQLDPDRFSLKTIANPFAEARHEGVDLVAELASSVAEGNKRLDDFCEAVQERIAEALSQGFDGILYRLAGANPTDASPMEYGGFFLERDRELLEFAASATCNVLLVEPGRDAYIDFVSDLPAHIFAWDIASSGIDLAAVRALRSGPLACDDAGADVYFKTVRAGELTYV